MGLVTNVLTTQKTINADITAFPVDRDDDAEVLLEAVGTESRRPIDSWYRPQLRRTPQHPPRAIPRRCPPVAIRVIVGPGF